MKKRIAILALVMICAMLCQTALATQGDITVHSAKVYADPALTQSVGKLKSWTPVNVKSYGSSEVRIGGKTYFISTKALVGGELAAYNDGWTDDLTMWNVKAYSDAAMIHYVGTIPKETTVTVRYGKVAALSVKGKTVYIRLNKLLNGDVAGEYNATLKRGTRVYMSASTKASSAKLKRSYVVNVCKVKGGWALVRETRGALRFRFVRVKDLKNITEMD